MDRLLNEVTPNEVTRPLRLRRLQSVSLGAMALALALQAESAQAQFNAFPEVNSGTVRGQDTDTIVIGSDFVDIVWFAGYGGYGGAFDFLPFGSTVTFINDPLAIGDYTVLNRIAVDSPRLVEFNGTLNSRITDGVNTRPGGTLWFYSPGGILVGGTALLDVGSLLLTTGLPQRGNLPGQVSIDGATDVSRTVRIEPGARINSVTPGHYVAMVAPRIVQGGNVFVNGTAAYVAAEDATLTIGAGLFDIRITTGSWRNSESSDVAIEHPGTTTGSASTGPNDPRRIYFAAVPKNLAMRMLLAPTRVGFELEDATSATVENGTIVLSAGGWIEGGEPVTTNFLPLTTIELNGNFTSRLIARAPDTITLSGGSYRAIEATSQTDILLETSDLLTIAGNVSLTADDNVHVSAFDGGESDSDASLTINGDLTINARHFDDLGLVTITAGTRMRGFGDQGAVAIDSGGSGTTSTLTVNGAVTIDAGLSKISSVNEDGNGGTIVLASAGVASAGQSPSDVANLLLRGPVTLDVSGNGGRVLVTTGGLAEMEGPPVTRAGLLDIAGALTIDASGEVLSLCCGYGGVPAFGGSVDFLSNGGPLSVGRPLSVNVRAMGDASGLGWTFNGGSLEAGSVNFTAIDSALSFGSTIDIDASASGTAADVIGAFSEEGGPAIGGSLIAGTVTFAASLAPITAAGAVTADLGASGTAGSGTGETWDNDPGEEGWGGDIRAGEFLAHAAGGSLTFSGGLDLDLVATGEAGAGHGGSGTEGVAPGFGGSLVGGTAELLASGGPLTIQGGLSVDASASGTPGSGDTTGERPAGVYGGIAQVTASDDLFVGGPVEMRADATAATGTAIGGSATLEALGGTLSIDPADPDASVTLSAVALGDDAVAGSAGLVVDSGAASIGGSLTATASGATFSTDPSAFLEVRNGTATIGGSAALTGPRTSSYAIDGSTLTIGGNLLVEAQEIGFAPQLLGDASTLQVAGIAVVNAAGDAAIRSQNGATLALGGASLTAPGTATIASTGLSTLAITGDLLIDSASSTLLADTSSVVEIAGTATLLSPGDASILADNAQVSLGAAVLTTGAAATLSASEGSTLAIAGDAVLDAGGDALVRTFDTGGPAEPSALSVGGNLTIVDAASARLLAERATSLTVAGAASLSARGDALVSATDGASIALGAALLDAGGEARIIGETGSVALARTSAIDAATDAIVSVGGAGTISFDHVTATNGAIDVSVGGSLSILGRADSAGAIDLASAGSMALQGATSRGGGVRLAAGAPGAAAAADLRIGAGGVLAAGQIQAAAARDVVIASGAPVTAGAALSLSAGDDVLVGAGAVATAATSLIVSANVAGSGGFAGNPVAAIASEGSFASTGGGLVSLSGQTVRAASVSGGSIQVALTAPAAAGTVLPGDEPTLGACVSGGICLGAVNAAGAMLIGQGAITPALVSLGGAVTVPSLRVTSAGDILLGQAGISAAQTIAGDLQLTAAGAVRLLGSTTLRGGASGGDPLFAISAGGPVTAGAGSQVLAQGPATITAGAGIALPTLRSATGGLTLQAGSGALTVSQAISAAQPISASGTSITLVGDGPLSFGSLVATAGDITIIAAGNLSVTSASAESSPSALALATASAPLSPVPGGRSVAAVDPVPGATIRLVAGSPTIAASLAIGAGGLRAPNLDLYANGPITIAGPLLGRSIRLAGADVAITGSGAIGSMTGPLQTQGVSLDVLAGVAIHLGSATGAGFRLDGAELGTIQTPLLEINALGSPGALVTIGDLSVQGSLSPARPTLFTPTGTLRVTTLGSMLVGGALGLVNAGAQNRIELIAGQRLDVLTPSGSIAVTAPGGGPAGTLRLRGRNIIVSDDILLTASNQNPFFSDRLSRLAQHQGADRPEGYLVAGGLLFEPGETLHVQNAGSARFPAGITAGPAGITVISTQSEPAEVILYGRTINSDGTITYGRDVVSNITLEGQIATGSRVNGCAIDGTGCTASPIEQTPGIQDVLSGIIDGEGGAAGPPLVAGGALLDLTDLDLAQALSRIEEPVTGVGNEEIWRAAGPDEDDEDDEDEEEDGQ